MASQRGDRAAFGHLIDRHYRAVYRFAYQCLGDHGDADDVCQEAFLKALRQIHSLQDGGCFRPWLYKIALNLVRRRRRPRKTTAPSPPPAHLDGTEAVEALKRRERADLVHEEVGKLPQPLQVVTALVLMNGVTQKEAAAILGRSEATVSRDLATARQVLRARLRHLTE